MSHYLSVNPDWLRQYKEDAINPEMPIIDAHHHVWDIPNWQYMFNDVLADFQSGHNIVSSVFVQCYSMYRRDGPKELRPLGETEFANGIAAMAASGAYGDTRICEGIVGMVNLTAGARARELLQDHVQAAGGRFKGIRQITAWDDEDAIHAKKYGLPERVMSDSAFREGFGCLAPLGLTFDAYVYHTQLDELSALARAFPETNIVVNHAGGPLGIGRFANRRSNVLSEWRFAMRRLASNPNVFVKLGGLAMHSAGFDFHLSPIPRPSEDLAAAWSPYISECIDTFGPDRCMFESNFPVDKGSCSYVVLWNAFKKIAARYTSDERSRLFSGTARIFYKLPSISVSAMTIREG